MVNVRALHLWGEVRENLRTPVGAMLRLSGSSNKAMNSDSSVYNWEEESSFVPSKYRFVKISIWLDFYFINMSVFLESILLNLIDFWLWVLSHMAAMNMNYTLLRGQKCQSFHIQKFVCYRKYETNKTKIDSIFLQRVFTVRLFIWSISRIANVVQCHSLLSVSGNKDCHGFRFSIFRIVISDSNVKITRIVFVIMVRSWSGHGQVT